MTILEYLPVCQYIPIIREIGGTFRWKVVIKMNRIYQLSKSGYYLALKRQHLTSYSQLCLPVKAELLPPKAQQWLFAPLLVSVPDA